MRRTSTGPRTSSVHAVITGLLVLAVALVFSIHVCSLQIPAFKPAANAKLPLSNFYDTPNPLSPDEPGALIRSAAFDDYDLPLGVNAVRILYHSRSANGEDVAASGVVLFPDRNPPAGGWPVIAWAHGFTGVARQCAPSLSRHLPHIPLLSMYVNLGYAVVASDYTGLGTSFRHAFADNQSNAFDVINSVAAARRAVTQLRSKWIAIGADNGGNVAITVAELQHEQQDPAFLGSIAVAPLEYLEDLYATTPASSPRLVLLLAYGIKTVYPQFEPADIFTSEGLHLYQQIACACEAPKENSSGVVLKSNWRSNQFVQNYFDRNRLGAKAARAPLLVIAGDNDYAFTRTAAAVTRLCKQGDGVQFEKYPESDPGRVMGDSVRDQIGWIEGRFRGLAPVPNNCTRR
jgi:alpha-beta hydrolase superfamily lysophospholipase